MTRLTDDQRQMVRHAEAAPVAAALAAAIKVAALTMPRGEGHNPRLWASSERSPDADAKVSETDAMLGAVAVLAPFVRAYPDAPAEALYRQAASLHVHDGEADAFAALPLYRRLAYEVFRLNLIAIDKAFAAERALLPAEHPKPRPVPIEDTIFEADEPMDAQVSYAKSFPKAKPAAKKKGAKR